ncbi:MAG: hypothetical protein LBN74_00700 [Prevotella sp.]|jgi:hypothetical protein|nr:hypothetical protein [Prevotella sp.]
MKRFNFLLSLIFIVFLFGMYSCSSGNDLIVDPDTNEESQSTQELRSMYLKLKNKDVKFLDDLINRYERELKSSKKTKSGDLPDITSLPGNEYIEKYITGIDWTEFDEQQSTNSDSEEIEYDYQVGTVDYEEIISDTDLSDDEKEMLIISFLYLDAVIGDLDNEIEISSELSESTCLDTYKKNLTKIRNKYLGVVLNSWMIYFTVPDKRVALHTAAGVLRDALSGKHYKEIQQADDQYQECMQQDSIPVDDIPGGTIGGIAESVPEPED